MKKTVFCILTCLLTVLPLQGQDIEVAAFLPAQAKNKGAITVQFPYENMPLAAGAKQIYLFGKLHLSRPTLEINGQPVPVYKNGTFLAFVPVEQGTFLLRAQSKGKTYQALRHVQLAEQPIENFFTRASFDENTLYPAQPLWVLPGETLTFSARGTPNAQASVRLLRDKKYKEIPLSENPQTPGSYQASYTLPRQYAAGPLQVVYRLQDPQTNTAVQQPTQADITVLDPAKPLHLAQVTDPGVKLRFAPVRQGSLYPFYRAFGEVLIDGRAQGLYRLNLGTQAPIWLEENKLSLMPEVTYQPNHLQTITVTDTSQHTTLRFEGSKQVPVSIQELEDRLEITFYYTEGFKEDFQFNFTGPLLDRVLWTKPQNNMLTFTLYFKQPRLPWGHNYAYEQNDFVLRLIHPPLLTPTKSKPLRGARILLDAGHSPKREPPYDGLVSPSGYLEYEANLALAKAVKAKLKAAGATVIMTREKNNKMTLPQRYEKAKKEQAHLFVSLHHNALPETANPLAIPRGYSIYYTYPHSKALAQSLHHAFKQSITLADNGLIQDEVLFVPRIPDMPSVLIENAFMILPEQEKLVMSRKGRKLFARTIYQGIVDFYQHLATQTSATP